MSVIDSLQHFLDNIPDEEIKRIWESGNHLDKSGVKVIDWLKQKGIEIDVPETTKLKKEH